MATAFQWPGTGAWFAAESGAGTEANPWIPEVSTGAAVASVPVPGTGGYFGVASGAGNAGNPYVLAVGGSGLGGVVTAHVPAAANPADPTVFPTLANFYIVVGAINGESIANPQIVIPAESSPATVILSFIDADVAGDTLTVVDSASNSVYSGSLTNVGAVSLICSWDGSAWITPVANAATAV